MDQSQGRTARPAAASPASDVVTTSGHRGLQFEEPLLNPARYLGTSEVGALVICSGRRSPGDDAVRRFLAEHGPFRERERN